jgi:dihydroneopterin aldolase/2-amino-4-hydroxy-6-hydroxymethyldihydropteridine diphosphokinase
MNKPTMDPQSAIAIEAVDAFVAVGANLEPKRHIEAALIRLMALEEVLDTSRFYLNDAQGHGDQPRFINGVWRIRTALSARALKYDTLRGIEAWLGRKRSADKYAPRVIDLDLVLYGDAVIDEPDLAVPDPDIYSRPFVAVPLAELAPGLVLPDTRTALSDLESTRRIDGLEVLEEFSSHLKRCMEHERRSRN